MLRTAVGHALLCMSETVCYSSAEGEFASCLLSGSLRLSLGQDWQKTLPATNSSTKHVGLLQWDNQCIYLYHAPCVQDDERLDALLKDLAKRAPDVLSSVSDETYSTGTESSRSNLTSKSPTSEVAADLRKIKSAIAGMQQKLQLPQKSKKR